MKKDSLPSYQERRALLVEQTRQRVLDAVVETLAKGVTELSIPAVAKAAGVSVPTVTRHFKTKKGLLEAASERLARERPAGPRPSTVDELVGSLRVEYRRTEKMPELVRAALASEPLRAHVRRSGGYASRYEAAQEMVAELGRDLKPEERAFCADMIVVIGSSYMQRAFHSLLGRTADQAADAAGWALERILGVPAATTTKRGRS